MRVGQYAGNGEQEASDYEDSGDDEEQKETTQDILQQQQQLFAALPPMTTQQFQQKQQLMGPKYTPTMSEVLQVVHANGKKKKRKATAKANAMKGVVKKGTNRLGGKK